MQVSLPYIWVNRVQAAGIEYVRPRGGNVVAEYFPSLILPIRLLIILIRVLEPASGSAKVQLQHIRLRGVIVDTVEEVLIVAMSMQWVVLWCVQITTAIHSIETQKIAKPL